MGYGRLRGALAGHHVGQFADAIFAVQDTDLRHRPAVVVRPDDLLGDLQVMVPAGSDLRQVCDADDLVGARVRRDRLPSCPPAGGADGCDSLPPQGW